MTTRLITQASIIYYGMLACQCPTLLKYHGMLVCQCSTLIKYHGMLACQCPTLILVLLYDNI